MSPASVCRSTPPSTLAGDGLLAPTPSHGAILDASVAILDQGIELLDALPEDLYQKSLPIASGATIGGHFRHCLDHFSSCLLGAQRGLVDFDQRERDPAIERDPALARAAATRLRRTLQEFNAERLALPVRTRCQIAYGGLQAAPETQSTLAREFVYVVAHAVHHYALIKVLARSMDIELPETFGVAPSTLAHQRA